MSVSLKRRLRALDSGDGGKPIPFSGVWIRPLGGDPRDGIYLPAMKPKDKSSPEGSYHD